MEHPAADSIEHGRKEPVSIGDDQQLSAGARENPPSTSIGGWFAIPVVKIVRCELGNAIAWFFRLLD
jgi:hypothetical protein